MARQNGYYWVKPAKLSYKDKWVIATYENGMFWVHGTGEAYLDISMSEIDETPIVREQKQSEQQSNCNLPQVSKCEEFESEALLLASFLDWLESVSENSVDREWIQDYFKHKSKQ